MKNISLLKCASLGAGVFATIFASSALAQTPVSTSVQMSGSCSKCDLSHRDMERMSLQGSNFSGSNFSHSNLSGGKFYKSNLAEASFNKAYMMKIEGDGVVLRKSNLRDATLSEATLTNSDLSYADLRRADLTEGNFQGSSFKNSILKAIDAMEADFQNANFDGAFLSHGNFTDADFGNATLTNTVFGDAILDECNFDGANLSGANLFEVNGLVQEQLNQACGNEKTVLPEGLSIPVCPPQDHVIVEAKIDKKFHDTYTVIPAVPTAPKVVVPYYLQSESEEASKAGIQSGLDIAIDKIERAIRGMPLGSPTRTELESVIAHLESERAKGH